MESSLLKRGGLDYHELATVTVHPTLEEVQHQLSGRWLAFSAKSKTTYADITYRDDDVLLFGNESTGLPAEMIASYPPEQSVTTPMQPGNRSLNLANAVSVVVYEAWRQVGFEAAGPGAPD